MKQSHSLFGKYLSVFPQPLGRRRCAFGLSLTLIALGALPSHAAELPSLPAAASPGGTTPRFEQHLLPEPQAMPAMEVAPLV